MIESARYTEYGSIIAVIDGVPMTVPDDMGNRHRQMIAEWEALGNTIAPYVPPPPSAADVDAERDRRIHTLFTFNGVAYQLDPKSQANITAMGADARFAVLGGAQVGDLRWADPDTDFGWIATDNSVTPMDAQTMAAFADAAKLWVSRHIFAARAIKNMNPIPADYTNDSYWPSAS